jgi:hypothetical protein
MASTAAENVSALPGEHRKHLWTSGLLIRFLLVAVFVGFSYLFRWEWLRYLTSEANLRLDLLAGIHLQRLSSDLVMWKGVLYRYENACTFVDVYFGSIPLLWDLRRSVARNLGFLGIVAVGYFAFNVFRLTVSDILFAVGLPWDLAHNVVSGITYFAVWVWVWSRLGKLLHSPTVTDRQPTSHEAASQ